MDVAGEKPKTRGDCSSVQRPCLFVSCKNNLYLDVSRKTGAIKLNFPDLEPGEMKTSCALDVADKDGVTLEKVAEYTNLTRERVRQIELKAILKIRENSPKELEALHEFLEAGVPLERKRGEPMKKRLPMARENEQHAAESDGADDYQGSDIE